MATDDLMIQSDLPTYGPINQPTHLPIYPHLPTSLPPSGVITAVYLSNGDGRHDDNNLGNQDEIDFEFKGNDPTRVQTNVFLNGQEQLEVTAIDMTYLTIPVTEVLYTSAYHLYLPAMSTYLPTVHTYLETISSFCFFYAHNMYRWSL